MANRFLSNIRINDAYTFPASDGTNGQILSTDGSGNITFTDPTTADAAKRLEVDVKNVHGATLAKGTVVHAEPTGTLSGNVIEVVAADANSGRMPAIGVLNEALLDDGEGKAVMFGTVQGIDTSGFSVGDELYVSTTAGQFTATKPIATNEEVQKIAIVIKSHASNGLIKVFGAGRANDVPNLLTRNISIDGADFHFGNADQVRMGGTLSSPGLRIQHTGSHSYFDGEIGNMYFRAEANDSDMAFQADDGVGGNINYFYLDGSAATHNGTNTTQTVTVFPDNSKIQLGGDANGDLRLFHNGTNSVIANNTGNIEIINYSDDKDIFLKSDDGSGGVTTYYYIDGSEGLNRFTKNILIPDNVNLSLGNSFDFRIYHEGTDSIIQNYTGSIYIDNNADDQDIVFRSDDGSGGLATYYYLDGSLGLNRFLKDTLHNDDVVAKFGTGSDLRIQHSSGNNSSYIQNYTGDLSIENLADDKDIIFKSDDGSGGVTEYFKLWGLISSILISKDVLIGNDTAKLKFGASQDLEIYHDGSHSYIKDTGTGDLKLQASNDIFLLDSSGNVMIEASEGGSVDLFYSGSKKLETTSTGIDVTGVTVTDGVTSSAEIDVNLASAGKYFEGGSGNVRRLSITSGTNISAHALHTFDIASSNGKYEFKVNSATKFSLDTSIATFAGNVRLPNSGKLFLWNDHDFNYLMYDRWRASASAGMNIENAAATGSIFLRSGNALTLTLDDSQNATFAGDVTVAGDLVISGTQTILNTQTVEVEDNIIQLNTTQGSPDTATATTSGISVYRGDGVTQASFIFDDANDTWTLANGGVSQLVLDSVANSDSILYFQQAGTNKAKIGFDHDVNKLAFVHGSGNFTTAALTLDSSTATFAGDVTVNGGDVTIAKQNDAPTITLLHDGTNPSTNDLLFKMQFQSDYDGAHQNWGKIEVDTNASAVRTNMDFYVKSTSGTEELALRLEGQPSAVPNATFAGNVSLVTGKRLYFDNGNTYISEDIADRLRFFVGGAEFMRFTEDTADNIDFYTNATFAGNITLDDGAGASPELIFKNSNDETWKIWHGSQGVLNFTEGTNDRFQLLQGGNAYFYSNVGIGVSPGSQYGLDQNYTVTNPNDDFKFAYRIDANFSGADNTSSDREQGGIYLDIDSSADGDANDEHRLYGIHIDQKYTGFSDQSYGLYSRVETNNITEQTGTLRAVYGFAVADNANVNGGVATMTGGHFDSYLEDMGNINTAHGVFGRTLINSTRTADVESTFGVWGEIQIDSPESINYGDMKAVAAVIDNNEDTVPTFGGQYLYYGAYQGTKGSSAYGVYVTAEDKNYFSNKVGIGTSSPPQKLTVNGAVFITDDLISPGSAGTYTYNGTAIDYSSNGTRYWSWGSGTARGTFNFIQLENDGTNQQTALSINSSGDATFAGGITASSGTGHFSLVNASGYQLNGTYVMDSSRNLVNIAAITASGACTITSGTSVGLTINHDTFENGLVLHRNHASNAASIVFKNNTGLQGTLLAISSDNQPYWQEGTGTTSYKIWHENNDDDLFKKGADIGGSANLNNYTTPGFYHQNSNSSASSGTNYPANVAGMLTVTSDGVMVYQMYQGYATNHTYERKYYNGTWESWHLIYDSGVFTNNSSNWNTAFNDKINSASFNTGNGVLTLTQQDGGTVTVDLDGRYLTSYTEADTLATVTGRGASTSSAITITNDTYGIFLRTATNGAGSTIRFSDQQPNAAQTGDLTFYHSDSASIGSGASFHFQSTETQLSIVAGDADTTGKFYSYPQADAGEVDFGWANDTDTGMYRPAANQVGLVAGGSRKLLVDSNGVAVQNGSLNVPGGSVGTPSIGVGDTDTGFYNSGSNAIGVSSGGVKTAEFQGGGSFTLVGGAPTISMLDTTSSADDFYLHVNSNNFYVLCDRNGSNTINGGWDSPHPLQLEGDTDIGYLYGHRMFADNYHPNADTWTTSRTITLGGDLTGSVSIDGSANVTLSAQVVNDSHTHDDRYYTESEVQTFFNRGYIDRHHASNLPVGWYTIATNTGDRALGQFQIWETSSSDHMSVLFNASHHFGTDSSNDITVTANSRYSGTNFRYIRIKEGGTYDGAVLQVYVDGATNSCSVAIVGGNAQESGWVLKDWIADGTDPGDVTSYNSMTEKVIVDLDKIVNGGIMTSGEYYATNNRVFHDGYHPNADAWTTGRTISLTGEVTGSVTGVDGSGNVSISTTVSNTALDDQYVDVTGDTMTGNLLGRGVSPTASITYDLGTTSNLYNYTHSRYFQSQGTQARTKVRVWTGTTYGIGMQSGYSFGSLGGTGTGAPEYAQTFQTSNTANRGWWFGDTSHSNAQGAFCVTTTGKGTFAHSLRIGYGEGDTTQAGTNGNLDVNGTLHMNGSILMSNFDITEVNRIVINDPGPTEGLHWSGGNGWQITESPDDMTTNSGGNLQFATGYGGTLVRRVTMTTGGALNATGDVVAYSDRRVKENIETIDNALDKVSKLRGVSYNRNDVEDKSKKIGVIAQEVKEILPEVVHHSEDIDVYSVAYGNMAGLFIEAIKELKTEIEELKKQIK